MELLGSANWWMPKWLDRIVPRISVDAPRDLRPTAGLAATGAPVSVLEPAADR
jgi:RND superfamily putative drug exporter